MAVGIERKEKNSDQWVVLRIAFTGANALQKAQEWVDAQNNNDTGLVYRVKAGRPRPNLQNR